MLIFEFSLYLWRNFGGVLKEVYSSHGQVTAVGIAKSTDQFVTVLP